MVLLPVGSRYESRQLNGASHFIEHMMFKGTRKRPNTLAIAKELDGIGALYNAFTGKDHTGYWIKSAKEKLEIILDILADMLFNSVFDKREFQREKGVILEEIKMYQENPLLYIDQLFEELLFQGQALGRSVSGRLANVRRMRYKHLFGYKKLFYRPGQMIVVIAGGVEKHQAVKLVKKFFLQYQDKKRKRIKYKPFIKRKSEDDFRLKIFYKKDLKQAQVALGGFAYPYNHPRLEAATLLSIILGGNMSSRLFIEVRERRGLAYSVRADLDKYQDVGSYVIQAGVDKEKVPEAIKVILDELKKVRKNGVTKEELSRAKDYLKGIVKISLENSGSLANWYGSQALFADKIVSPTQRLKKIKKVTRRQIREVIQDFFQKQTLKLALIGPFRDKRFLLRILKGGV